MVIKDVENIYNNLFIKYYDKNRISDFINNSTLKYIHCAKIYHGERLGYMYGFVTGHSICILSNLNSNEPYINENQDDVYDYIKNTLKIKFTHYDVSDDVMIFGVNCDFLQSKDLEKIHDSYFRGYYNERIAECNERKTKPVIDKKLKYKKIFTCNNIIILLLILLLYVLII